MQEISGYTFLVEQELIKNIGAITVDMTPYGFSVTSAVNLGGNGGGCSGSCSSC